MVGENDLDVADDKRVRGFSLRVCLSSCHRSYLPDSVMFPDEEKAILEAGWIYCDPLRSGAGFLAVLRVLCVLSQQVSFGLVPVGYDCRVVGVRQVVPVSPAAKSVLQASWSSVLSCLSSEGMSNMFTRVGNLLSRPFPSIKTPRISWLPTTVSWFHTPVSTSWMSQTHYTQFSIARVFTVSASCRISLPLFCYGLSMIRIHRFSKWGSIAEGIMWNRL